MIHRHFFSSVSLVVAILFLLSVSVHPAMAADSVNKMTGGCTGCSTGALSSIPGFEGKKVPVAEIREVAANSGTRSDPAGNQMSSAAAVPATRLHQIGTVSLTIADPRTENSARNQREQGGTMESAASDGTFSGLPDAITANMSSNGYVFSTQSEVHRYETTLTSDDFLTLNSSQKDALAAAGFASVSSDTIRSYRDVSYYTFTNTAAGTTIYVMEVQQLDTGRNAIGELQYSISPEIPADPYASQTGPARMAAASTIDRNGSCFWNWVVVSLLVVALIVQIVLSITSADVNIICNILLAAGIIQNFAIGRGFPLMVHISDLKFANLSVLYAVGPLLGLAIIVWLAYEIYKLGVCMKWWDELVWDSVAWSYQYSLTGSDNGKTVPVGMHDRVALFLVADTRTDRDAAWVADTTGDGGLVIRDNKTARTENGTIQSWLIDAKSTGLRQITLRYVTTKPVPPTIPATTITVSLQVSPGNWKPDFVDNSSSRYGTGLYTSLVFDKAGVPHISYYDAGEGRIMYASLTGTGWVTETVADSAGTYSTSLAFDKTGNPAISFGDGYHFGNLVVATKNGNAWDTVTVAKGSAGDAGQDSSLAFDKHGVPHITFNDGQHFATLEYATQNGTTWNTVAIDNDGPVGDTGYGSSLKFDAKGFPHVAYTNGKHYGDLMYAENTGAGWTVTKIDNGGGRTKSTGFTPSLALDAKGFPHISYYDASDKDLRYASWNGTGWETETIDRINDVGAFSSLAIGTNGQPHISYYDASNHELRYATKTGDRWIMRTIDNDGKVGQFSSLALDQSGHPCFAYFDDTHHALKYAGWVG